MTNSQVIDLSGGNTLNFTGNLKNSKRQSQIKYDGKTGNQINTNIHYEVNTVSHPTFHQVTINNDLRVKNNISIGGELLINGKLNVTGSTTSVNTINLDVSDNIISLNNGQTGTPLNDSGILIIRGDSSNAFMGWAESDEKFIFGTTNATSSHTGDLTITPGDIKINKMTLINNLDVCGNLIVDGTSRLSIMTVDPSNKVIIVNGDLQADNISADTIYANNGYITSNYDIFNGVTGELRFDASYISICIDGSGSNNDWREIEIEKLYQLAMDSTYLDNTIEIVQTQSASINTAVDYVEQIFGAQDDSTTLESILSDISGAITSANTAKLNLINTVGDANEIIIDISNSIAQADTLFTNLDNSLNNIIDAIESQVIVNISVDDMSFNSISVSEMSCDFIEVSGNASFGDVSMNNLDVSGTFVMNFNSNIPTSNTASGTPGQIAVDASYIYVCTTLNNWNRVALSLDTWS